MLSCSIEFDAKTQSVGAYEFLENAGFIIYEDQPTGDHGSPADSNEKGRDLHEEHEQVLLDTHEGEEKNCVLEVFTDADDSDQDGFHHDRGLSEFIFAKFDANPDGGLDETERENKRLEDIISDFDTGKDQYVNDPKLFQAHKSKNEGTRGSSTRRRPRLQQRSTDHKCDIHSHFRQ